jgi:RHS repeat-associated protein
MKKIPLILYFISLMLCCGFAAAEDAAAPLATLTSIECEPSGIVDGCVNVISGLFFDYEIDMVIPGPEPLKIERLLQYNNPHPSDALHMHSSSWTYGHVSSLSLKNENVFGHTNYCAYFSKGLENSSVFSIIKEKHQLGTAATPRLDQFLGGITNCSKGAIGAQTNPLNRELTWSYKVDTFSLRMEDGTSLLYKGKEGGNLLKEHHPSGLHLSYDYDKHDKLERISLSNSKLASLADYTIKHSKNNPLQKIIACDGRAVYYHIDEKKNKSGSYFKLQSVIRPNAPPINYSYYPPLSYDDAPPSKFYPNGGFDEDEKLARKSYPEQRFKEIIYYTRGMGSALGHPVFATPDQAHFRRVSQILAPLGATSDPMIKYRFNYHLPNGPNGAGSAGVYDALDHKTDYDFNKQQRLTSVKKYFADGSLYTKESLYWGPQDSHEGMQLRVRSFKVVNDPYDIFTRQYTYDDKGNILTDRLCGNICGTLQTTLHVDENGTISGEYDSFEKTYSYSDAPYHLLTELKVGNLRKTFHYKPGSNLLEACFHYEGKRVFLRHFYTYDNNAMMIEHIVDDGSSTSPEDDSDATERKIERIKRSDTYPFGLPEVVEEYYVDLKTKYQHLYLKKINTHDTFGRLKRQKTYGSNGQFAYEESWTYDAHGNIRSEVNRLGQEIIREFDPNDNMIYQRGIDTRLEQRFTYNFMNQLRQIDEIHPEGILSKKYDYDPCGNPLATSDVLGNETNTEYDEFNRPIRVIGAPLADAEGDVYRPETTYEYDPLGNPIKITSPEGHTTEFAYTLLGKPYFIRYPDGTTEHFEYDLEGRLLKEVAKNGMKTLYTYDVQGRNTKKKVFTATGKFLFQTEARYNTFHLIEEVDAGGTLTSYSYDALGRKVSSIKGNIITTFDYDFLGRVIKTTIRSLNDPKEGTITYTLYDSMGRVVEEWTKSCSEKKRLTHSRYSYDDAGNKSKIEQWGDGGISVTLMEYDTHAIPIKITDPKGNISLNRLILDHGTPQGLRVFVIERTDPHGVLSLSIQDTHGRVVETLKKDPFGNTLQKTEYQKNSSGLCTAIIETVFFENQPLRTIKNCFEYDFAGRLIATIQASGTPEEKRSSVQFNHLGQKISSTKPSGESLLYLYDAMGRLSEYSSKDNTIHYRYTYDIYSNPILVENLIDGNSTSRKHDIHHRAIEETLGNSLICKMAYTPEGYLKNLNLPDGSSIQYTYAGPLLQQVDRIQNQEIAYTHQYTSHDLTGRLLKSSLIHNLGPLTHQFNLKGQITKLTSSFYSEENGYDPLGNLTTRTYTDSLGPQEEKFNYNPLNQLSSENSHSYTHDSLYNRRSKDGKQHNHNALNQLLTDGETQFSYDMNGNLVKEIRSNTTRTFTYDALDRLKTLQIDHESWEFFYDEQNRCISYKTFQGNTLLKTEHILYIGQNDIGTADAEGNVHTLRILGKGLGAEIGAAIALEIHGKTFAPLHDHNGNLIALVNSLGTAAETYRYTSFGEEQIFTPAGAPSSHSLLENPWRFSSKRHFGDYLLFGRRFYDPAQGRWLTPDPVGYQAGPNLYTYVSNNPQTHFDPYGLTESSSSSSSSQSFMDHVSDFFDRACDFFSSAWDSVRDSFSSGYESVREGVRSIFHSVQETTRMVGSTIKFISRNMIVLPFARDFLGFLGHCMENGTHEGYPWPWKLDKSQQVPGKGEYLSPHVRIRLCNGVDTLMTEFKKSLKHASDIFGCRVEGAYNSTDCLTVDLIETALQKLGIPTDSVDVLVKAIRDDIQAVGGVGTSSLVVLIAHSQGGQILHNALKQLSAEEKSMIAVCTLGTAQICISDGLRYAVNYVSDHDPITRAGDPAHYNQAQKGLIPEVKFIKSLESGLFDHSFMGKTYTSALEDFADYFYTHLWSK